MSRFLTYTKVPEADRSPYFLLFFRADTNSKNRLFNDLLKELKEERIGFQSHQAVTTGNQVVGTITDCLWFLDPQSPKLESRGIQIPAVFLKFLGCKYNDPKKHKKKIPKVKKIAGVPRSFKS